MTPEEFWEKWIPYDYLPLSLDIHKDEFMKDLRSVVFKPDTTQHSFYEGIVNDAPKT
jgi:hypothetical protein